MLAYTKLMKNNWENNSIQFPRLISEIERSGGGGFSTELYHDVADSMDVSIKDLRELIDRACDEWDKIVSET